MRQCFCRGLPQLQMRIMRNLNPQHLKRQQSRFCVFRFQKAAQTIKVSRIRWGMYESHDASEVNGIFIHNLNFYARPVSRSH